MAKDPIWRGGRWQANNFSRGSIDVSALNDLAFDERQHVLVSESVVIKAFSVRLRLYLKDAPQSVVTGFLVVVHNGVEVHRHDRKVAVWQSR